MSHATLEKQLQSLPEECLDEVSHYIEYILFRQGKSNASGKKKNLTRYFGSLKSLPDGMELQRRMRDEWD